MANVSKKGETRLFNLNSEVKVKLTPFGVEVLKNLHNELFKEKINRGLSGYKFHIDLDDEGYFKTQMHELMKTFGEYMVVGSPVEVFETMEILIPEDSKKHCF